MLLMMMMMIKLKHLWRSSHAVVFISQFRDNDMFSIENGEVHVISFNQGYFSKTPTFENQDFTSNEFLYGLLWINV